MEGSLRQEIFFWIKVIFITFIVVTLCRHYIFSPTTVNGESMEPTFKDENKVMISKLSHIKHFDIIVFHSPLTEDETFIKRVIGLPGDEVRMKDDILYINGIKYEEPYLVRNKEEIGDFGHLTENFTVEVPEGSLFVMGDNRRNSDDSRLFGPIDETSVIGVVKLRFHPLKELSIPK